MDLEEDNQLEEVWTYVASSSPEPLGAQDLLSGATALFPAEEETIASWEGKGQKDGHRCMFPLGNQGQGMIYTWAWDQGRK